MSFNKSWAESASGFQVWFLANPEPAQQRSMGIPHNFCPPEIPELQKLPSLTLTLPDSFCKPLIACMKPHLVEVPRMSLFPPEEQGLVLPPVASCLDHRVPVNMSTFDGVKLKTLSHCSFYFRTVCTCVCE